MPVCSGRLVERKDPVNHRRRHVALVEEPEQPSEITRTAHRGAEQVELTEVERPDVQRGPLAARRTQHDERAAGRRVVSDEPQVPTGSRTTSKPLPQGDSFAATAGQPGLSYRTPPAAPSSRARSIFAADEEVTTTSQPAAAPSDTAIVGTRHQRRARAATRPRAAVPGEQGPVRG